MKSDVAGQALGGRDVAGRLSERAARLRGVGAGPFAIGVVALEMRGLRPS